MERINEGADQGAQDRPQGRRPGLGRGAQGRARQAVDREGQGQRHRGRRRRHHRERRQPREGGRRDHRRLPRPPGRQERSKLAEQEGVEIRLYDIIYDALDDVKAAMAGLLAPIKREVAMGKLEVRETFSIPKIGTVAGCMVTEGKINRKAHLRIVRDAVQVYEGKVGSLRRFKDDVSEVQHGFECGVMVAGWNELKAGRRHRGLRGHRGSRAALASRVRAGRSCVVGMAQVSARDRPQPFAQGQAHGGAADQGSRARAPRRRGQRGRRRRPVAARRARLRGAERQTTARRSSWSTTWCAWHRAARSSIAIAATATVVRRATERRRDSSGAATRLDSRLSGGGAA